MTTAQEVRETRLREFQRRFRGELLLLLTECWAARTESRADLGQLLEQHHVRCKEMLKAMFDFFDPPPPKEPKPAPNGAAHPQVRKANA